MDRRTFSVGALVLSLALLALLALAVPASAFIYWADSQNQTIGRAANDGSEVNDAFIHTGQLPFAVTVDGSHIYWVNQNSNSIGRANIDGTGVNNSLITGTTHPDGIAVNGTSLFWSTIDGPIGKAELDGSNPKPNFITEAIEPCGLAVDAGHLWWADIATNPAYVGRSSLDGFFVQPQYVNIGLAFPCGIAVNSANVYWADTGFLGGGTRIGRADVATGKSVDPSFIAGAGTPCGLALDSSSHMYWANAETNTIGRANTDATGVDESYVVTGGNQICGVAVDNLAAPPQPLSPPVAPAPTPDVTPPTTKIVKGPGHKLAGGRASFSFRAGEPGSRFQCKLDKGKPKACNSPKRYRALKPGKHTFKVWAIDAAGNKSVKPAGRSFRVPT